jgi:hypothetical protein
LYVDFEDAFSSYLPNFADQSVTPSQLNNDGHCDVLQTVTPNRHLALNGKTLRAIPVNARRGACASFGGALRPPFGLAPVIIRHVEYSG